MSTGLSEFQLEVARMFFDLPAAHGFVLAGGAALLATGLTTRATRDLDFFGPPGAVDVQAARDEFEAAVLERAWRVARIHDTPAFVRLHVHADEELIIDLGLDSPPCHPPVISIAGPTHAPEELAGRKLVALFSRAEARDFADVAILAQRFGKPLLLEQAARTDRGFDQRVLAEMIRTLDRFDDDEIPVAAHEAERLRGFFRQWADELDATG